MKQFAKIACIVSIRVGWIFQIGTDHRGRGIARYISGEIDQKNW